MSLIVGSTGNQELLPEDKQTGARADAEKLDPKQTALMDYAEAQLWKLCASRGLDWNAMNEEDRERFVDDLIHKDRECAR